MRKTVVNAFIVFSLLILVLAVLLDKRGEGISAFSIIFTIVTEIACYFVKGKTDTDNVRKPLRIARVLLLLAVSVGLALISIAILMIRLS